MKISLKDGLIRIQKINHTKQNSNLIKMDMIYQLYEHNAVHQGNTLAEIKEKYVIPRSNICIVLPTYNEEGNIGRLIEKIIACLKGRNHKVIVIDDESKDRTRETVLKLIATNESIYLLSRKKKGVFTAQQDGASLANSDIILFMDSDFSHSPETILNLLDKMPKYDLVTASRFCKGAKIDAPFSRKFSTISLNFFLRLFLGWQVTDYTGIFFAIREDKWKQIKLKYDAIWGESGMEIYKEARRLHLSITEVPFTYKFREEGQSKADNLLKYAWVYLKRALQVKFLR